MPLDFWENVLHIIRAYKPNQITDSPIQASATVDVYTNIIPSRQSLPTQQQQQPTTMLSHISPHPPISSFNPAMIHPAIYANNPLLYNQHNYINVLAAAQYIMNAAAAYNSMLSQQQQQQQQYTLNSPVVSPQQQHVQIKRKPVQYQKPTGYNLSPQIEQRIQRKKVLSQQQIRQPKPPHYPSPQQPPQQSPQQPLQQRQQQHQNKKKVRFIEKPTLYTYEREESDHEEQTDGIVDDDNDVYYEDNHNLYDDMDHHYTQAYSINSNRNGDSNSNSGYMQDRPWASSIILNKRNSLKGYRYDDEVDYDEEEDDINRYGDLWERRYYIRRHDSLGHRSPVRRSRV